MPMTSLTCTSRQARTQRLHWMQASRLTAIAEWLRSGCRHVCARAWGSGRRRSPWRLAVFQNSESGSCATSMRRLIGEQQLDDHLARGLGAIGLRSSPSCRAPACGCSLPPARARPRSRPCRRGNCRRRGSRAAASSTDAAARCRAGARRGRSSRPRGCRPRGRRVKNGLAAASPCPRRRSCRPARCARRRACRRRSCSPPAAPLLSWP